MNPLNSSCLVLHLLLEIFASCLFARRVEVPNPSYGTTDLPESEVANFVLAIAKGEDQLPNYIVALGDFLLMFLHSRNRAARNEIEEPVAAR